MTSITTSIPRMFLDCVQRIALIQLGNNFTSDFVSWHLQLRATEHRLRRWGKAAGILDEQSNPFLEQLDWRHDSRDIPKVCYALKQILKQLSRAKEDSDDISGMCDSEELKLVNEMEQLSFCESDAKRAKQVLEKLKSRYQSSLPMTPEDVKSNIFALYQPKQLQKLLGAIGDHVQVLESLFPVQLSTLAAQETRSLELGGVEALASCIQKRDPILASALEEALPKHSRWENIKITGTPRVHLGSHYSEEPKNQGRSSWFGLVIGGDSVVHAGHTYGY